ncbi:hypothetical protein KIH87_04600 [Paraneptunicella aestuarii]|uniref:hypothetical protein n=1 Tax=Paraneptunicella aestuarii TaxID=2831148 RepID=UPI001E43B2E4|nr:hypothetical protein [Paraneptunicella aestuarii]UAA39642.1 hypothetical protein KIH87_04600 [Paraneptunicella aestuarii]
MVILGVVACGGGDGSSSDPIPNPPPTKNPAVEAIEQLWPTTVGDYLEQDLWSPINIYDAGVVLMLPLEYAFHIDNNASLQIQFHDFFERYLAEFDTGLDTNDLSRFQFYYVLARYLAYTQDSGWNSVQQELYSKLLADFNFVWLEEDTAQAGNAGTRVEIIQQKLNNIGNASPKYTRATIDLELFGFAIAGELAAMQRKDGQTLHVAVQEMLQLAYANFQQEVAYTSNGWLYQPGQWDDYVDYLYAGNTELSENLEPSPVPGIATDSSHSHRMPLWLLSLAKGFPEGSEEREYFEGLSEGFESQFMSVVYVPSSAEFSGPRMTNFMDGNNGIYRYRFHNNPELKLGYEPYNLSGTLLTGFYPFMYNTQLRQEYADLTFPLSDTTLQLYLGLGGTPDVERAFQLPDYYAEGYAQVYSLIASLMVD